MSNKSDISHISFENSAFPTEADMRLWNSLTPEEQLAVTERDEAAGFASGIAEPESADEVINRVRSKKKVHAV